VPDHHEDLNLYDSEVEHPTDIGNGNESEHHHYGELEVVGLPINIQNYS
jgi:hypothetical protein